MQLLDLCREKGYKEQYLSKFELAITKAEVLKNEKRKSGDTVFDHNLRVAELLADNKSAPEVIVTAILQGSNLGDNLINSLFGKEVAALMAQVEQLRELTFKNKQLHAEAFKRMLLTTLQDVRAILIKLADKIDNLKSLEVFPEKEQKRIAEEVLEIYSPLADRLGVDKIKNLLEDLAFKILNPKKYKEIEEALKASSQQREEKVKEVIETVREFISDKIKIIKIKGRPKQIYSIHKKLLEKNRRIFDLIGVRIIVPEIKDCYMALGLLHEKFEPVEGRLKDYITNPKPNSYQSIHTTVIFPPDKIVEFQIRTPEMDELAEEGIAAHWRYKGLRFEETFERKLSWLRSVLELQKDNPEFLETLKVDVFGDKIYCYTPKGDVKELPKGACVLDFAFMVHEEVGCKAVAGRVNGKFVPLKHKLVLGDVVEVVTNKNQRPRRSWIKLVKSTKARQKIRRSLKDYGNLSSFYYRELKPEVKNEYGLLVDSEEFKKAICILAKCCLALPGEAIIGILTKRRIISVHRQDCRGALKLQERWIPVNWRETFSQKITFEVRANERSGLLADLVHTIASAGFEVKEAKAKMLGSQMAQCSFTVVPKDLENLKELIRRVEKVKGVKLICFE